MSRRLVAVWIVLASALAAAAPSFMGFRVVPQVRVVHVTSPVGNPGTVALHNDTGTPLRITSVTRTAGCDVEVATPVFAPFDLEDTPAMIAFQCSGAVLSGIKRCLFDVQGVAGPLGSFEGVCEGGNSTTLTASTSSIDFGSVGVGQGSSANIQIQNTAPTTINGLAFHTTDLEGNFEIGAPCNPDARACDAPVGAIGQGSTQGVTVWCRPKSPGTKTAVLHVASTTTTQYLATPIMLTCNGTGATGPVFALSGTPVDVGDVPVAAGSTTRDVFVRNAGGGTLALSNVTATGAGGDWSYVASGACTGTISTSSPCDLAANAEVTLTLTFDPSAIGPRNATLLIDYTDTVARQSMTTLRGTGTGGTLALESGITALDFGVVPINVTSQLTFRLANQGNAALTDVTVAVDPAGAPFGVMPPSPVTVPAGGETTITATCRPTAAGTFSTTYTASSPSALSSGPIAISATCEGTTQALYAEPTSIALGEVRQMTSPMPRTIRLLGTSPVDVTGVELETTSTQLALTGPTSGTTPLTLQLEITPSEDDDLANAIVVTADDGTTLRIPISGSVVTAKYVAPMARSLGTFCVSQPTTGSSVILQSSGTGPIRLMPPTLAAGTASPFDLLPITPTGYPATLAPMAEAIIEVTPKRQAEPTMVTDQLVWTTDVPDQMTARTTISAMFVNNGGAIAPTALEFPETPIHLPTENAQTITLQNCDRTPIVLDPPQVAAPFRIESSVPAELQPNEIATFAVGFHPVRTGVHMETLRITSEQLEQPLEVSLLGTGITGDDLDGFDDPDTDQRSFYGCADCSGGGSPSGALLMLGVVVWVVVLRSRR